MEAALVAHELTPTVGSLAALMRLAQEGRRQGRPVHLHLKLDTGMARVGLPLSEVPQVAHVLRTAEWAPHVQVVGVMTHLVRADETDPTTSLDQALRFRAAVKELQGVSPTPLLVHYANSAGALVLTGEDERHDLVRLGIALYGLAPHPQTKLLLPDLHPALTWHTRLVQVRQLKADEPVSYGATWRSRRPTRLGTIPVGYADGLRRLLSWSNVGTEATPRPKWRPLVRGLPAPLVGRVCMDLSMLDLTDIGAHVGDPVLLLGGRPGGAGDAAAMAEAVGSIHYEVTCLLGQRVPRLYLRGGKLVAVHSLTYKERHPDWE